jgi:DNA-binding IscR family transcriptional regulator
MLGSCRGPGGGYSLTPSPASLTVAQIVEPFEDFRTPESCLMGGPCDPARSCAAHARRTSWTDATMELLHQTTLADLLPRAPRDGWEAAAIPSENDR